MLFLILMFIVISTVYGFLFKSCADVIGGSRLRFGGW